MRVVSQVRLGILGHQTWFWVFLVSQVLLARHIARDPHGLKVPFGVAVGHSGANTSRRRPKRNSTVSLDLGTDGNLSASSSRGFSDTNWVEMLDSVVRRFSQRSIVDDPPSFRLRDSVDIMILRLGLIEAWNCALGWNIQFRNRPD